MYEKDISERWSRLPFAILPGHHYRIMRLDGEELGAMNPFALLANGFPAAAADMASYTVVVVGAKFRDGTDGFYVLTERTQNNSGASGESLLDFDCTIVRPRS